MKDYNLVDSQRPLSKSFINTILFFLFFILGLIYSEKKDSSGKKPIVLCETGIYLLFFRSNAYFWKKPKLYVLTMLYLNSGSLILSCREIRVKAGGILALNIKRKLLWVKEWWNMF